MKTYTEIQVLVKDINGREHLSPWLPVPPGDYNKVMKLVGETADGVIVFPDEENGSMRVFKDYAYMDVVLR